MVVKCLHPLSPMIFRLGHAVAMAASTESVMHSRYDTPHF